MTHDLIPPNITEKGRNKRQVNSTSMTSSESLDEALLYLRFFFFFFSWKIQVFIMSDVNC